MSPAEADALRVAAAALSDAEGAQEIARRAAREVTRLLGADTSVYFVIDERQEYAIGFAGYHVPTALLGPDLRRIRIADLPIAMGGALGRHAPAATRDERGQAALAHPFIRALPIQPRGLVYAPVMEEARLRGALVSYWWRAPHAVTDGEIELAMSVARQAAVALAATPTALRSDRDAVRGSAEMRYRYLFDRSLAGIFRTRRDGHVIECNAAFARMLGYDSRSEIIGRHASEFYLTPRDRDTLIAEVERSGAITNAAVTLKRRDGSTVRVLANVAVNPGEDEQIYEGQILDITDRERAEAVRREAEALRSVASLAHGAAHAINNPLTVVRGTLDLLRQHPERPVSSEHITRALRAVDEVVEVVRRMSRITRLQMLDDAPGSMQMLDIRESSPGEPPPALDPRASGT